MQVQMTHCLKPIVDEVDRGRLADVSIEKEQRAVKSRLNIETLSRDEEFFSLPEQEEFIGGHDRDAKEGLRHDSIKSERR